ncbi:MAG: solute:sodium symporter family transporter [Woeseiaceae bacterium]|nr:solute:sodium symporter family transporter [Woeseiaceae bacterium]
MTAVVSFIAFTATVATISWWLTRNDKMDSSEAYFLAGRSLTAWVIAGSLILTNLSTEHLIGLNADAFNHTIAVMAWETTAALAMVLAALYFLPKYLSIGLTTIPEFLARRFDNQTRVIATALFLFSYAIAILPVVLLFGAEGLEALFQVSASIGISAAQAKWFMVWGIGVLGSMYAIFGGLKAVAISDTINGIGFLIAGLLVPVLALNMIGDGNIMAGIDTLYTEERDKFDITGNEPGSFLPFGVLFTGMIVNQIFFWCTNQSIIQRALGAKSLKEAQKGVLIAASFKLLGPVAIVLPGVIAYHMFKDTLGSADYLQAYPTLVRTVLPTALTGFFAAVMVGAVLSTFNSVLNSAATLFAEGIYKSVFNPASSGRAQVHIGRWVSALLAVAAMLVAPTIDTSGSLYIYLQQINATFFGPMLAVILCGLLTRRISARAAKVALVAGPVIFYLLNFAYGDAYQAFMMRLFGLSEPLHFLHTLAVVFVLTLLLLVSLSFGQQQRVKAAISEPGYSKLDLTPWRHAKIAAALISTATIACYIALAQ